MLPLGSTKCQAPRFCRGASCYMIGTAPLAALAPSPLALFCIQPSAELPWMAKIFVLVWRTGACLHHGLALTIVHGCLDCHGTPILATCLAHLKKVRRHCSPPAGSLCGLFGCAHGSQFQEAPRPTAANADQGALDKKKERHSESESRRVLVLCLSAIQSEAGSRDSGKTIFRR